MKLFLTLIALAITIVTASAAPSPTTTYALNLDVKTNATVHGTASANVVVATNEMFAGSEDFQGIDTNHTSILWIDSVLRPAMTTNNYGFFTGVQVWLKVDPASNALPPSYFPDGQAVFGNFSLSDTNIWGDTDGLQGWIQYDGSGSVKNATGADGRAFVGGGGGKVGNAKGLGSGVYIYDPGLVTNAIGLSVDFVTADTTTNIVNAYGIKTVIPTDGSNINAGLSLGTPTPGNWSIYQSGPNTNYLEGPVTATNIVTAGLTNGLPSGTLSIAVPGTVTAYGSAGNAAVSGVGFDENSIGIYGVSQGIGFEGDGIVLQNNKEATGVYGYGIADGATGATIYDVYADTIAKSNGGTVANGYGLYVKDQTNAVANYAIKTGIGLVDFGDSVTIRSNLSVTGTNFVNNLVVSNTAAFSLTPTVNGIPVLTNATGSGNVTSAGTPVDGQLVAYSGTGGTAVQPATNASVATLTATTVTATTWAAGSLQITNAFTNLFATASRVAVYDAAQRLTNGVTTATEIGYVNGVTSAIQTQFGGKASLAGDTLTGNLAISLVAGITNYIDMTITSPASVTNYVTQNTTIYYATNAVDNKEVTKVHWFRTGDGNDYTFAVNANWKPNKNAGAPTKLTNSLWTRMIVTSLGNTSSAANQTNVLVSFEYY